VSGRAHHARKYLCFQKTLDVSRVRLNLRPGRCRQKLFAACLGSVDTLVASACAAKSGPCDEPVSLSESLTTIARFVPSNSRPPRLTTPKNTEIQNENCGKSGPKVRITRYFRDKRLLSIVQAIEKLAVSTVQFIEGPSSDLDPITQSAIDQT
jgi:hypothetical protein